MINEKLSFGDFIDAKRSHTSTATWDIDTPPALENCIIRSYFFAKSAVNPEHPGNFENQVTKFYPFVDTHITRATSTIAWDNKEGEKNLTPIDFYSYIVATRKNPDPDPTRDLGAQQTKIYPYVFWLAENPPWLRSTVNIQTTFSLDVTNPPEYVDELVWIEDTYNTIEQLSYREKVNVTSKFALGAVDTEKLAANINIKDTYNATRSLLVKTNTNVNVSTNGAITYEMHPAVLNEKLEIFNYTALKGTENAHTKDKLVITDTYLLHINNPQYENLLENARISTSFKASGLSDQIEMETFITHVRVSDTYSYTATSSGGTDVPTPIDPVDPTPGTDTSAQQDFYESVEHYVYIRSWLQADETITLREVLAAKDFYYHTPHSNAVIRDGLTIRFTNGTEGLNPNKLETSVVITDFLKISSKEFAKFTEFVRITDYIDAVGGKSEEATTTYVVNESNETTRYEHWPFESYAAFKGMYLGCNTDGIYVLSGDNDNGEPIEAMINFGKQSFGSANYKRVPYVYASLASDGDVYLQVSCNDDEQYMYPARKVDEYNATARFDLGRGIKANYLTFELYNENGSKFDLRNLWIYLTELSRRI